MAPIVPVLPVIGTDQSKQVKRSSWILLRVSLWHSSVCIRAKPKGQSATMVFLHGDARLCRACVMQGNKGRGIYTRFMYALLCKVFEPGDIQRVYIHCHKANVVAYKAHYIS